MTVHPSVVDGHSGFHSLFKFECSTTSRANVIKFQSRKQWTPHVASLPMKSFKSHKKCSWVEISNFNNFCSIHCRALKFGTHEEELEPILLTNLKVQNLFHRNRTLLGVFFCVCLFSGFLTWLQDRHAYNPQQPMVFMSFNDWHVMYVCLQSWL